MMPETPKTKPEPHIVDKVLWRMTWQLGLLMLFLVIDAVLFIDLIKRGH